MVKVIVQNSINGSGALYLSQRLIATASHLTLYDNNAGSVDKIQAGFQCNDGTSPKIAGTVISRGRTYLNANGGTVHGEDDWALAILDRNVDTKCARYLEAFTGGVTDLMRANGSLSLIGYAAGLNHGEASIARHCAVLGVFPNFPNYIAHCCGASMKTSGGPLMAPSQDGWYALAAIQNKEMSDDITRKEACTPAKSNAAMFSSTFYRAAAKARELIERTPHLGIATD